jgi:anti-sigma-K factor RskA
MTCEELRQDYAAYALGILEDPERGEITSHLSRRCPECVPGVAGALGTVGAISGAVAPAEPPKRLRRRVIAMVRPEPERSWTSMLVPWAVSAILALALIYVSVSRGRVPSRAGNIANLEQALSILNDPLTKDVTFGTAKPSKGRVFVSPDRGIVFIAANLPALQAGKTFEMWVIPTGGNPIPAGTFHSQADATAVYVRPGRVEANAATVAVTIEPEGGSPAPTTTPFIAATLT